MLLLIKSSYFVVYQRFTGCEAAGNDEMQKDILFCLLTLSSFINGKFIRQDFQQDHCGCVSEKCNCKKEITTGLFHWLPFGAAKVFWICG
jgi:hypothetical protein